MYRTSVILFLCILGLGFNPSLYAQSSYKVTYNISAIKLQGSVDNLDERGKQLTEQVIDRAKNVHYILLANNKHSYFKLQEVLTKESNSPLEDMLFLMAKRFTSFNENVYADPNNQTIVFTKNMVNKEFMVKRSYYDFNWVLQENTKKIIGFNAKKAIGTYYDATSDEELHVEAWFIPSLPLQFGPDIFMGLPGLILEVSLKGAIVTAINIETNVNLEIDKIDDSQAMSQEEFEDLRKNLTKKYIDD